MSAANNLRKVMGRGKMGSSFLFRASRNHEAVA
jgi:hypothetical protein